jgi:hypothetical protein
VKASHLSMTLRRGGFVGGLLLVLASQRVVNGQSSANVRTLDRVCGRLISVADVNDVRERDWYPLRKTIVRLYRQSEGTPCCDSSAKVSETRTGRSGKFSFELRKSQRGLYWLAVTLGGRELTQLVRFEPPKGTPDPCSNSLLETDSAGHFTLRVWVTVD